MAKVKSRYVCSNCGSVSSKWLGKCPDCSSWNSFIEEVVEQKSKAAKSSVYAPAAYPVKLKDVKGLETDRYKTGLSELDVVLGGGAVKGSVVLVGGEPGIGKSTIMMQVAGLLSQNSSYGMLYLSGEESADQLKMRANRLGINSNEINLLTTTSFEDLLACIDNNRYDFIIVDSIQTVVSAELTSSGGTVGQVKHITYRLVEIAKSRGITIFIVGQVTKDGAIAGPKVLEHLVDTVLYFEGDYTRGVRLLRTVKNRFGSTNEVGLFEMTSKGLSEVSSGLFINQEQDGLAGQALCSVMEGTRAFLVEIQALVAPTFFQFPKRNATGVDLNRLQMLIAVLEKRGGINLSAADVYMNVAGGLKLTETGCDLAICAALLSSYKDKKLGNSSVFIGEVGLSGEIRAVGNISARLSEASKLGIKYFYSPVKPSESYGVKVIVIKDILELIKKIV